MCIDVFQWYCTLMHTIHKIHRNVNRYTHSTDTGGRKSELCRDKQQHGGWSVRKQENTGGGGVGVGITTKEDIGWGVHQGGLPEWGETGSFHGN